MTSKEIDRFWKDFLRKHWEKDVAVLRSGEYPALNVTEEEVFRAFVRAIDLAPSSQGRLRICVYVNGKLAPSHEKYAPRASDGSFEAWHARVNDPSEEYMFLIQPFHLCFGENWGVFRDFMRPILQHTGLSLDTVELNLFAGRYRKTAFGVHQDNNANFYFPLIGTKRMRTWPGSHPFSFNKTFDYEKYLDTSVLLEGRNGDLLFWNSATWHIGESDGEFNVAIALCPGWQTRKYDVHALLRYFAAELSKAAYDEGKLKTLPSQKIQKDYSVELPAAYQKVAKLLGHGGKVSLDETLKELWLEKMSADGFGPVPGPRQHSGLSSSDSVQGNPKSPVLWTKLRNRQICIGAQGLSFRVPSDKRILELIRIANSGKRHSIEAVLKKLSRTIEDRRLMTTVLETFIQYRCLDLIP